MPAPVRRLLQELQDEARDELVVIVGYDALHDRQVVVEACVRVKHKRKACGHLVTGKAALARNVD